MSDRRYLDSEVNVEECKYGIGKVEITTDIYEYTKGCYKGIEDEEKKRQKGTYAEIVPYVRK